MKMTPCLDPGLCKVQRHRIGTVAKCRTGKSGSLVGTRTATSANYDSGTNQMPETDNQAIDRAAQTKHSIKSSRELTRRAYESDGVARIALTSALLMNQTTEGGDLHAMLFIQKPVFREDSGATPLVNVNHSEEIIKHRNVRTETLREIAKRGNPEIRGMARERLKSRAGLVRRILRLY